MKRKLNWIWRFGGGWLAVAAIVVAAEQTGKKTGTVSGAGALSGYIQEALANNPDLAAVRAEWQADLAKIPQATAFPDPRVGYGQYLQRVETRVGAQRGRLTLAQRLPWFGKRALRGEVASQNAGARAFQLAALQRRVVMQVKKVWYAYYLLHRTREVTQKNFDLLKALEQVARERYRTGSNLTPVMQAQVELGRLEDRLRELKDRRPVLVARLNALLGRKATVPIPWPTALPAAVKPAAAAVLEARLQQHPALLRLNRLAQREHTRAELAWKRRLPDVTFGVSYIDTASARNPTPDSGKDAVIASVSINLPLWRDVYRAKRREAELRQAAFEQTADGKRHDFAAALQQFLYRLRDASRKIGLYRDTLIPKTEQALGGAQQAFRAGKTGFLSVIDLQRMLLEFELSFERARVEQAVVLAELEELSGRLDAENIPVKNKMNGKKK